MLSVVRFLSPFPACGEGAGMGLNREPAPNSAEQGRCTDNKRLSITRPCRKYDPLEHSPSRVGVLITNDSRSLDPAERTAILTFEV